MTTTVGHRRHVFSGDGSCWCIPSVHECDEGHQHICHGDVMLRTDTQPRMTAFSSLG